MSSNLPQFVISFDDVLGETVFTVREEQHRDLAVYYAATLMEAQDWTLHPHCVFTAVHELGNQLVIETCDRAIDARIYTHSEQVAILDPSSKGDDVYYLCDGHAAALRVEVASEDVRAGDSITADIPVTYQQKSPHLA